MDEGHESQELAIPGKGKRGIAQTVRNILKRPANQATEKIPQAIEQTPGEMAIEKGEMTVGRARKILEFIVNIPESGLDKHERNLTPEEQYKRFGGIHYEDIKKAFGVYADHLVTTHDAKEPREYYSYRLLKEDLPGHTFKGSPETRYYDLELSIMLDLDRPKTPKVVRLTLHDGKRHGSFFPHDRGIVMVESQIPLGDVKPDSSDEKSTRFYDNLSDPDPHPYLSRGPAKSATLQGMRVYAQEVNPLHPEWFHNEYKGLHRGMRWAAANFLCWDENRIIYPDDLDKPPLDRGQTQLNKPS